MEIEKIFCAPTLTKTEYNAKYGEGYKTLYLLRKDIFWCRGIDPKTKGRINTEDAAPLAAFILLNVLFKFIVDLSGYSDQNFINKYFRLFNLNNEEKIILRRLRNAIVHKSYKLVWEPDSSKGETGKTIYFAMTEDNVTPLADKITETIEDETWVVNIDKLHRVIEDSVDRFSIDVKKNSTMMQKVIDRSKNDSMHVVSKENFINYAKAKKGHSESIQKGK